MGMFDFIKKVIRKPLRVVVFRGWQYLKLKRLARAGFWQKYSQDTELFYSNRNEILLKTILLSEDKLVLSLTQREALRSSASSVMASDFKIFGHQVPDLDICDFSTDWRFGKKWLNQFYKKYVFYEKKTIPYDVKFPWELSRLHYLVPVFAWQLASKVDYKALDRIFQILVRWRNENPLAYSVNWYPMEASMRVINLVMMLDFVRLLQARESETSVVLVKIARQLQIMISEHGKFVWENREFTDVRGNHFTANLVALLLAARALGLETPEKGSWQRYALKWLDREVRLQFCSDGVNFEKSCGYHKLVLELFMLAAIAREKCGVPFCDEDKSTLAKAASYSDAITRPDGLAANFGDTDDATSLPFNLDQPRSHGSVVELARAFFKKDIGSIVFEDSCQLAALFLLGQSRQRRVIPEKVELSTFLAGGYVVVRDQIKGFFFMADVGEVGMSGRGGHGHNDLLSFELCIKGQPIVVDSGCSGYTADLERKSLYRSTASHANVSICDEEIARFSGPWGILNDAHPLNVEVAEAEGRIIIKAGHDGYDRIAEGMRIWRRFEVMPQDQRVEVVDEIHISCDEAPVSWTFPIGDLDAENGESLLVRLGRNHEVAVASEQSFSCADSLFSFGYGIEIKGRKLIASDLLAKGIHSRRFSFYLEKGL